MLRDILLGKHKSLLGINRRNLEYVYPGNSRKYMYLADSKLKTKEILAKSGLPYAETYAIFNNFNDVADFKNILADYDNFVVKPNKGRGGSGIMIVTDKSGTGYKNIAGKEIKYEAIRKRICDILFGVFSLGMSDSAIIEKRIVAHTFFDDLVKMGLPDIRIITYKKNPVMAMLRLPTHLSDGKANLHQGGIGVGIDIETGETTSAVFKGKYILKHPDNNKDLLNLKIPFFKDILNICRNFPDDIPLNYMGFDFTLDMEKGPVIIEVNARPGLEIQNANKTGLLKILNREN